MKIVNIISMTIIHVIIISSIIFLLCVKSTEFNVSQVLNQLDLIDFPYNRRRRLAIEIKLGGLIRKFNEGVDNTDKMQRMITYWCESDKNASWQLLVDAVAKCVPKIKARQLAGNVGAIPPGELTPRLSEQSKCLCILDRL